MLWLLFLWLCFRQPTSKQDFIYSLLELSLANFLTGSVLGLLLQCSVLSVLVALKDRKLFVSLFVTTYLSLNFWVNLTDFLYTGLIKNYYHDEFFLTSFSYKINQLVLCAILAYTVSELMAPSDCIVEHPRSLSVIMSASFAVCVSLMLTFTYELTWYTAEKRMRVFKTEVTKVLMTTVYFYFFALLYMSWMWQLSKQIKHMQKTKERNYKEQRRVYEESL